MPIKKTLATGVAATTIMFSFGAVVPASATSNLQLFGVQETLKDLNGPLIGYTVTGLMPSGDRSLSGRGPALRGDGEGRRAGRNGHPSGAPIGPGGSGGGGGGGGDEGSGGSTGPNQASLDTTAGEGSGNSDVEGADAGGGG